MKNDILVKFIKDNSLDFKGAEGSGLNSACTIISGFALHINVSEADTVKAIQTVNSGGLPLTFHEELGRVFAYAEKNNYGDNWTTPAYKDLYKF